MEQWTSCQGQWTQSDFWLQLKQKRRNRKFGCRRWLMRSEMIAKYGSIEVADQIISAKLLDPEVRALQVRANPDMNGVETQDCRDQNTVVASQHSQDHDENNNVCELPLNSSCYAWCVCKCFPLVILVFRLCYWYIKIMIDDLTIIIIKFL